MNMIVIMSTFQDGKSGMDIRGLGLSYDRTLWTRARFCSKTVLERSYRE